MNRFIPLLLGGLLLAGCFLIPFSFDIWLDNHKVLRVVLLAGDDNVAGYAQLSHLASFMDNADNKTLGRFHHLRSQENHSEWMTRDDVFVFYERQRHKPWHIGPLNMHDYGAKKGLFGPEVEVGYVLGNVFDEPVILVKAGFPQKTLYDDWRSPSRPGHKTLGFTWTHTLRNLKYALKHVRDVLGPEYEKHRTQLVGIIWWHAYSDVVRKKWFESYYDNLKHLIPDFRKALKRPHLPIVLAQAGAGGNDPGHYFFESPIRSAQKQVCDANEFTKCVSTAPFIHGKEKHLDRHFHYFGHGDSMIEIGGVLADALVEMYYKHYEEEELTKEMETDYAGDANETESISVVTLLIVVALALFIMAVAKGRISGRTVSWNWNRLFFASADNSESEESESDTRENSRERRSKRNRKDRKKKRSRRNKDDVSDQMMELTPTRTARDKQHQISVEEGVTFIQIPSNNSALVELDEISSSEDNGDD